MTDKVERALLDEEGYFLQLGEGKLTEGECIEHLPLLLQWMYGVQDVGPCSLGAEDFIASPYYLPCFGTVELKDTYTGAEGGQESTENVIHFVDLDKYFKRLGYYQSHNGTEWYKKWYPTQPKEITITIYI